MKKSKALVTIFICFTVFILHFFFVDIWLTQRPNSSIILDKKWIEIWEFLAEKNSVHYRKINTKFENFPEFLKKVVILTEDKSFYSNIWISPGWIIRAIKNNLESENLQWATTISSGVIRNLKYPQSPRSYKQKIKEFYYAVALNAQMSKDEILRLYLNNIYFWNNNYGFEAASKYYFWKSLGELTEAEIISLAVIPKNSSKYSPSKKENHKKRFESFVEVLQNEKVISKLKAELLLEEKLTYKNYIEDKMPYVRDFYKINWINWIINSTIDYKLSEKIYEISLKTILELQKNNVWDFWVVVLKREDNDLVAMLWWRNYYSENAWKVNTTTSRRLAGSTLKPFTYLLSFKELWLNPWDTILDLPVNFTDNQWNSYTPQNFSMEFEWEVSLWEALSRSLNVPAVKLTNKLWTAKLLNFFNRVWFTHYNKNPDFYGLSLTLWTWEVSLMELIKAYWVFYNYWEICDIKILKEKSSKCEKIIEEEYTEMVEDILTNKYLKIESFPINSNLFFEDRNVFVKTGTSRNFRDNWALWYTDNYVIWVWVWNKDGSEMKNVSWATWAWWIFRKIVYLLEKEKSNWIETFYKFKSENFIKITKPLNWVNFKIKEHQNFIKFDFKTNIEYDSYDIIVNGQQIPSSDIYLEKWTNQEAKIIIYKDSEIVWEDSVIFNVE